MRRILYFGTDPSNYSGEGEIVHCPLIKITPRDPRSSLAKEAYALLPESTHLIFTSKNCVRVFFEQLKEVGIARELVLQKILIAVGRATAVALVQQGGTPSAIAEEECQEGLIELLRPLDLQKARLFLPRSSLSRPKLVEFLVAEKVEHTLLDLYDTLPLRPDPLPNLEEFEEIVFTSPSTVHAFMQFFPNLPKGKRIRAQGAVTANALKSRLGAQQQEIFYV